MPRSFQPGLRLLIFHYWLVCWGFFFSPLIDEWFTFQELRVVFVCSVFNMIWNLIPSACSGLPREAAGFVGSCHHVVFRNHLAGPIGPVSYGWCSGVALASPDVWRSCYSVGHVRSGEFFIHRRCTDGLLMLLLISQLALAESYELAFKFPWSVVRDGLFIQSQVSFESAWPLELLESVPRLNNNDFMRKILQ